MNNILIKALAILIFIMFLGSDAPKQAAEQLSVPSALGVNIKRINENRVNYVALYGSYNFPSEDKVTSTVTVTSERSIGQDRSERQLKTDKRWMLGLEKVNLWSEEYARYGVISGINILFVNPLINDTSLVAVYKGKDTRDIFDYKIPGYPSAVDYVEGMLKHAKDQNFFTDNYRIIDIYARMDAEGRNFNLPYLEITPEGLKLTGVALFKKDRMVGMVPLYEGKILNLLSNGSGKGTLTIERNSNQYIDFYTKASRTVSCIREDNKYKFFISIKLKGDIISNRYNKDLLIDPMAKEVLEKQFSKKVEEMCSKFLGTMQKEYKVDSLELGRVAAAKYGRDTGTDWNDVVSNSDIKVNVKVKIDKLGRGDYY